MVNFLQEETFPYSKELLVMHYLQKGRYVEGIRLNELLKKDKKVCTTSVLHSSNFLCLQVFLSPFMNVLFLGLFIWMSIRIINEPGKNSTQAVKEWYYVGD